MPPKRESPRGSAKPKAKPKAKGKAKASPARATPSQEAALRTQFRRFDLNGNGTISPSEFSHLWRSLDPQKWTADKIADLLRSADKDGSGDINFEEFLDWVLGTTDMLGKTTEFANASSSFWKPPYFVIEYCDRSSCFVSLRHANGQVISVLNTLEGQELPYMYQCDGSRTMAWYGFKDNAKDIIKSFVKELPVVVLLDAARPGGQAMVDAVLTMLTDIGFDMSKGSSRVKVVVAVPTLQTPRQCLVASSYFTTLTFLEHLENQCTNSDKVGIKIAFVPREIIFMDYEILYGRVLEKVALSLDNLPPGRRNLGASLVREYVQAAQRTSDAMNCVLPDGFCAGLFRTTFYTCGHEGCENGINWTWDDDSLFHNDDTNLSSYWGGHDTSKLSFAGSPETMVEQIVIVMLGGLSDKKHGVVQDMARSMIRDFGVRVVSFASLVKKFGKAPVVPRRPSLDERPGATWNAFYPSDYDELMELMDRKYCEDIELDEKDAKRVARWEETERKFEEKQMKAMQASADYWNACRGELGKVTILDADQKYFLDGSVGGFLSGSAMSIVFFVDGKESPFPSTDDWENMHGRFRTTVDQRATKHAWTQHDLLYKLPMDMGNQTNNLGVLVLPPEDAGTVAWANACVNAECMRAATCAEQGIILLRGNDWEPAFLAQWLQVTPTPLNIRCKSHLAPGYAFQFYLPFFSQKKKDSSGSDSIIDHVQAIQAAGPVLTAFTLCSGDRAEQKLESLLDKLSIPEVLGDYTKAVEKSNKERHEEVKLPTGFQIAAAGETCASIVAGETCFATLTGGGQSLMDLMEKLVKAAEDRLSSLTDNECDKVERELLPCGINLRGETGDVYKNIVQSTRV